MLSLMLYVSGGSIYWVDFLSSEHVIKVLRSCFNKSPEQQVYVRKLLGYQFRIEYKQGISNKVVETLSYFPNNLIKTEPALEPITFDGTTLFLACIFAPLFDLVSQVHPTNTTDLYLLHLHAQFTIPTRQITPYLLD